MTYPTVTIRSRALPQVPALSLSPGGLVPMAVVSGIFIAYTEVADHSGFAWLLAAATIGALGAFVSLVVHELGHVHAARRARGVHVQKVVMMSLGAATHLEGAYRSGRDQMRVAAGGPVASLGLAAGLFLCLALPMPLAARWATFLLVLLNLGIAAVALLPVHPFDGHKLLVGLLWIVVRSEKRARKILRRIGAAMVCVDLSMTGLLIFERPLIGSLVASFGAALMIERFVARRIRRRGLRAASTAAVD
jgi:Zn-dependent protease